MLPSLTTPPSGSFLACHRLGGARGTPPQSWLLPTMAKTSVRRARTPHRGDAYHARLTPYTGEAILRRSWQAILYEAHFLFLRETLALFFNMCYTDLGYNHIISDREIRIGISYLYFLAIGKVVPAIGDTNAGRVSVGARPLFWSRREILSFPLHIFSTCAIL